MVFITPFNYAAQNMGWYNSLYPVKSYQNNTQTGLDGDVEVCGVCVRVCVCVCVCGGGGGHVVVFWLLRKKAKFICSSKYTIGK